MRPGFRPGRLDPRRPGPGAGHLTAPPLATEEPIALSLEGRAVIEGREVVRPVVPADDRMQAFLYRAPVPAQELKVAVSGLEDVPRRV